MATASRPSARLGSPSAFSHETPGRATCPTTPAPLGSRRSVIVLLARHANRTEPFGPSPTRRTRTHPRSACCSSAEAARRARLPSASKTTSSPKPSASASAASNRQRRSPEVRGERGHSRQADGGAATRARRVSRSERDRDVRVDGGAALAGERCGSEERHPPVTIPIASRSDRRRRESASSARPLAHPPPGSRPSR